MLVAICYRASNDIVTENDKRERMFKEEGVARFKVACLSEALAWMN
jgi:hypothetical protein